MRQTPLEKLTAARQQEERARSALLAAAINYASTRLSQVSVNVSVISLIDAAREHTNAAAHLKGHENA